MVFAGNNFAELFFKPFSVIVLSLSRIYLVLPISEGVNQFISPSQYSSTLVFGVPPPTISAIEPTSVVFHSSSNPLNRSREYHYSLLIAAKELKKYSKRENKRKEKLNKIDLFLILNKHLLE